MPFWIPPPTRSSDEAELRFIHTLSLDIEEHLAARGILFDEALWTEHRQKAGDALFDAFTRRYQATPADRRTTLTLVKVRTMYQSLASLHGISPLISLYQHLLDESRDRQQQRSHEIKSLSTELSKRELDMVQSMEAAINENQRGEATASPPTAPDRKQRTDVLRLILMQSKLDLNKAEALGRQEALRSKLCIAEGLYTEMQQRHTKLVAQSKEAQAALAESHKRIVADWQSRVDALEEALVYAQDCRRADDQRWVERCATGNRLRVELLVAKQNLEDKLAESEAGLAYFEARHAQTAAKLAQVEATQHTKLEHARNEVAAERHKNESLRVALRERKEAASTREAELTNELRTGNDERNVLRAQVSAPSLEPSSVENDRLRRELQSALASVTRLAPLQGQLKQSHARLAPANHRIRVLEQSLASATDELANMKREAALSANELILASATARKEAQAESAATLATVQQGLDRALAELKCSQVDSLALNDSLSRLTEELALAKSDAASRTRELAITRTDIAILQQSRAIPSTPVALARIVALEAELVTTRADSDAERMELLSKVETTLAQTEERERSLTAQLNRSKDELIIFRNARNLRIEELETQLAQVDLDKAEASASIAPSSISEEVVQMRDATKLLQSEINRLSAFSSFGSYRPPSPPSPHPAIAELEAYRKSSSAVIQVLRKKVADLQSVAAEG